MTQPGIVITGAGLVGAAQALALAQHGHPVTLLERAESSDILRDAQPDGRVSAISHASVHVLRAIGVWDTLEPHAGAIEHILVREGSPPRAADIHFDSADALGEPFGYMVPNRMLRRALLEHALEHPLIECRCGDSIETLESDTHAYHLTTTRGTTLHAALMIVADGRYSRIREQVGVSARRYEYGQSALVCTLRHSHHHHAQATEWFFPEGPLAQLPMHGGRHSCIVWTQPTDMAAHLMTLDADTFLEELARPLAGMLGDIALEGGRHSYPLNLFQAERYTSPRCAIIGDAAHAIHPIAGQGVNLGYRDVAVLTELLTDAMRNGQDPGSDAILAHYQRWRSFDATSMIAVTDGLNRLFSNRQRWLKPLRRAGMMAFERSGMVKSFFMSAAMGMQGDLPKMLRAQPL